jgi:carbon starvation protein CstA
MNLNRWITGARLAVAILILAAIGTQFMGSLDDPHKSIVMFWSEFTYQSNLIVAIVLLIGAWFLWNDAHPGLWWDLLRGAMVVYTAMTFVVYRFLVSGTSNTPNDGHDYYASWASDTLHKVVPVIILIDWLLLPPVRQIDFRRALIWTLYPLAYCGYSLIRGPIVGWYPYNFLDPADAGGWGGVALYVLAIVAGFLLFSIVVIALGRLARHWRPGARSLPVGVPA